MKSGASEERSSLISPEFSGQAENHVAVGSDTFVCSRFQCEGTPGSFSFLSDKAERVPEQVRCGKRRTPSPPVFSSLNCLTLAAEASFSLSHWGLFNPQHLSHFTTPMAESRPV